MSAVIYLEGGGATSALHARCQEGFHKLLDHMGFAGRKPRLVACGGREQAFDRFKTALKLAQYDYIGLWIDSEDPVSATDEAWGYLAKRDRWARPEVASNDQVLFMVTCMETWIAADPATLEMHYGKEFHKATLPPLQNLESCSREDVQDRLERATGSCRNAYRKGKRSFVVLGLLSPDALRVLPSFRRVEGILKARL